MTELVAIGVVGLLVVARATTSWLLGKHVQAVAIEAPPQPRPSSPYRVAPALEPTVHSSLVEHSRFDCPDWCPYCARDGLRRQACKRCDGAGSDPVFERRPTCLRCDGAGKDPGGHYSGVTAAEARMLAERFRKAINGRD